MKNNQITFDSIKHFNFLCFIFSSSPKFSSLYICCFSYSHFLLYEYFKIYKLFQSIKQKNNLFSSFLRSTYVVSPIHIFFYMNTLKFILYSTKFSCPENLVLRTICFNILFKYVTTYLPQLFIIIKFKRAHLISVLFSYPLYIRISITHF